MSGFMSINWNSLGAHKLANDIFTLHFGGKSSKKASKNKMLFSCRSSTSLPLPVAMASPLPTRVPALPLIVPMSISSCSQGTPTIDPRVPIGGVMPSRGTPMPLHGGAGGSYADKSGAYKSKF